MPRAGKAKLGLVEDALKLDAKDMRRLGVLGTGAFGQLDWDLTSGRNQSRIAEARYRTTETELFFDFKDEKRTFRQSVRIVWQPCHLGGCRRWFLCPYRGPAGGCFRRVRVLFLPEWANQFGCRHCHQLIHKSAREHDARVDWLRRHQSEVNNLLADDSGSVFAQFGRVRLAGKALNAIEKDYYREQQRIRQAIRSHNFRRT